jgi:hypothetical protein
MGGAWRLVALFSAFLQDADRRRPVELVVVDRMRLEPRGGEQSDRA